MKRVLAFDFGASSGRAMIGELSAGGIKLTEVHRFPNEPVQAGGTLYWDILRLFHEIKTGIRKAFAEGPVESIGIDTWGVDFGLLDAQGRLLENPVHYRDARTHGMLEEAFKLLPRGRFYEITGNQFMEMNTAFQLLSLVRSRQDLLDHADKLLMIPDLMNYMLTGVMGTEFTIASTAQLLDLHSGDWSDEVIGALGIPRRLFTPVVPAGALSGTLTQAICNELHIPQGVPVVSVCAHDTQSAVLAAPALEEDFAFISCGTWSLLGTELRAPLIGEESARLNLTNEGGYGGSVTLMKNIIGLWLIQESRRQWAREGKAYSYAQLEQLALGEEPLRSFIDPDAPAFVAPGDIPGRVRQFCLETGQPVPQTVGQVMRCIYESLAMKYRYALGQLEACTGKHFSVIHLLGGGAKDGLLCRMTADACARDTVAGPVEATVLGNAAVQLIALGELRDVAQARRLIAENEPLARCAPQNPQAFDAAYARFQKILV